MSETIKTNDQIIDEANNEMKARLTVETVDQLISEFTEKYPHAMLILRIGGVYPREYNPQTINPYNQEIDSEYMGNVGEHGLAVANLVKKWLQAIPVQSLPVSVPETQGPVERAIVHDATKGLEILRKKANKKAREEGGNIESGDTYTLSAYEAIRPILEKAGIPQDIIEYLQNAGKETGHNSLPDFVVLHEGQPVVNTKRSLGEMMVHLADDMTFTPIVKAGEKTITYYLSVVQRMAAADFPNRYPFLYTEGFGFDLQTGKAVIVRNLKEAPENLIHVRSYADWQVWVAKEVSKILAKKINPQVEDDQAEEFLVGLAK
jgi:hypothetical protein